MSLPACRLPLSLRALASAALLLAATPRLAAAQVPGVSEMDWRHESAVYTAQALTGYNEFVARWTAAWRAADVRRLASLYSPAAAVGLAEGDLLRGGEAVSRMLAGSLRPGSDIRLGVTDFVAGDDLLSAAGPFTCETDGEAVTGYYTMVLRLERGRWQIRSQLFSPALPLAARADSGAAGR